MWHLSTKGLVLLKRKLHILVVKTECPSIVFSLLRFNMKLLFFFFFRHTIAANHFIGKWCFHIICSDLKLLKIWVQFLLPWNFMYFFYPLCRTGLLGALPGWAVSECRSLWGMGVPTAGAAAWGLLGACKDQHSTLHKSVTARDTDPAGGTGRFEACGQWTLWVTWLRAGCASRAGGAA